MKLPCAGHNEDVRGTMKLLIDAHIHVHPQQWQRLKKLRLESASRLFFLQSHIHGNQRVTALACICCWRGKFGLPQEHASDERV
jgi:hypothetical protein